MGQPFVGEIRMFAGNFNPSGWAFCNGSPIAISQNDTLFTLIGTTYGGDGQETFDLPNLGGRVPVHMGTSPSSGTVYQEGESGGVETVTLNTNQIPNHGHALIATHDLAGATDPTGKIYAQSTLIKQYFSAPPSFVQMNAGVVAPVGGSQPHENMQPYQTLNYIISLYGIYPPPN